MSADDARNCLLCDFEASNQTELEEHIDDAHPLGDDDEGDWLDFLLAIPVLLWQAGKYLVGIALVVGIVLAALGVFDKTETADSRSCPGYKFAHSLGIANTQAVEPAAGWTCEYSLDDEDAFVRFRNTPKELEIEIEGRGSTQAYKSAIEAAKERGFEER